MKDHPDFTFRHRPARSAPRRGFALLITITLLAFLVLLLVSLATLTRVETQVASNSQHLSEARQNALMALNIALGQLQKYAGPDQRVTTTADLLADTDKSGAAVPASIYATSAHISVQAGARYWTAVWGNNQKNITYALAPNQIPPTTGDRRGVTPGLLNWLVSGNETAAFSPNGSSGGTLPGTGITYAPDAAIDLSDPAKPTIKDAQAVILVGANSVGPATAARQDYVAAPLVAIKASAGSVPGADPGASSVTIGHYAWWIGDEGVKARVNLQNGYQKTGDASDQINSFITAQRSATEFMDRTPAGDTSPSVIGTDFDFTNTLIPHIQTPSQLPLLAASSIARDNLASALKNRFHDLTTQTFGVLSDSYAGGLKKDLSADIADSSSDFSYRPTDATPIFTPIAASSKTNLPTWGHLRSWAHTTPDLNGEISPSPASDTSAGIAPVIAYASIGFDVRIDDAKNIRVYFFPVVALFNPYSVAFSAAKYDIGFQFPANSKLGFYISKPGTALSYEKVGEFDWGNLDIRPTSTAGVTGTESTPIYFTIDANAIPPGETHLYCLNTTGGTYAPGAVLKRIPYPGSGAEITNYVVLPGSFPLAADVVTQPTPTGASDGAGNPVTTTDTSYYMDLRAETVGLSLESNHTTCTLTLAQPGKISDPAGLYQTHSIIVANDGFGTGTNHVIRIMTPPDGATATPDYATKPEYSEQLKIADSNNWTGDTQGARAALRYGTNMESRGDYNAADRFGLPSQVAKPWLRISDIRAPFGQLTTRESQAPRLASRYGNRMFGIVMTNDNVPGRDVALFPKAKGYALNMTGTYDASGVVRYTTLFDILGSPDRLLSLGQLQHVPFARYTFYSAYPFGNSMADVAIGRTTHFESGIVPLASGGFDPGYDLSWHLNRALWDKYFVSGIPSTFSQADIEKNKPLPDSRMTYYKREGVTPQLDALRYTGGTTKRAYDEAAANLLVAGAFNVNSTSEQAWRAILGGTYGVAQNPDYADPTDSVDQLIPFPRFSRSLVHSADPGSPYPGVTTTMIGDTSGDFRSIFFNGNRGLYLKDGQASTNDSPQKLINELARTLVREIRQRGPFLSLSDFVNRSMLTTKSDFGIKGALQSAIDTMDSSQANPFARWNTAMGGSALTEKSYTYSDIKQPAFPDWDPEHYMGGPIDEEGTNREAFRLIYAFGPKYLTQADVLSTLGPILTARSDTFTIRTYGERINPATHEVEGRAWCEAVVQRTPDYIYPADSPQKSPSDSSLSAESKNLGRRFVIVSFRWLSASDI